MNKCIKLFSIFCMLLSAHPVHPQQQKKDWTFLVYIAGDNDLSSFIQRNINQMMKVGSNKHINIVALVNRSQRGRNKTSKIFYIEKNKQTFVKEYLGRSETDSGSPKTLMRFCNDAIKSFPANNYALILWDHGTGPLNPSRRNRSSLERLLEPFSNKESHKAMPHEDLIQMKEQQPSKAICFDDTTGGFLTEESLHYALSHIQHQSLQGQKFSIIGFDACLMATIETASLLQNYADIMVASQEVELGAGWNYSRVLAPFAFGTLNKEAFGVHITNSYARTYGFLSDYTFSCIDLQKIKPLEESIKELSSLLKIGLSHQHNYTMSNAIKASRNRTNCTHFDEPTFIDLSHFLKNLEKNTNTIRLSNGQETTFKSNLSKVIHKIISQTKEAVMLNKSGKKYPHAAGLSIYMPEHTVHHSYKNNKFSNKSLWRHFLSHFHTR